MLPVLRIIVTFEQTLGCSILLGLTGTTFAMFAVFRWEHFINNAVPEVLQRFSRIISLERMLQMLQEVFLIIAHATILATMNLKLNKVKLIKN